MADSLKSTQKPVEEEHRLQSCTAVYQRTIAHKSGANLYVSSNA